FDRTSSVRSDFFCFYIIFTLCSLGSRGSEDFLHLIGLCPKFQLKLKFISWYNNFCVKEKFQHGPLVKRLRHRPFTAVTRVQFPSGPSREPPAYEKLGLFCCAVVDKNSKK